MWITSFTLLPGSRDGHGEKFRGHQKMKRLFFYMLLLSSISLECLIPFILSEIPFKGTYTAYYISMGASWLYMALLAASILVPVKLNFPVPLKVFHIIVVMVFTAVTIAYMNIQTP